MLPASCTSRAYSSTPASSRRLPTRKAKSTSTSPPGGSCRQPSYTFACPSYTVWASVAPSSPEKRTTTGPRAM